MLAPERKGRAFIEKVNSRCLPATILAILTVSFHQSQAAQTHVAREGCNVIYITYVTRAGVALQATVENIRDFVWEICH